MSVPARAVAANRLPRWVAPALAVGPVVVLGLFYAWPVITLLARGLDPTAITDTLGRSRTWEVLWFTIWQAQASTVLTLVIGLAPAFVLARYEFAGRRLLDATLAAVFVLPTVVMGAAVLAVLPASIEQGVMAILVAHVVFNLAVVARTVGAVLATIPRDREGAAATLGASPWQTFVHVTLPAIRPALMAAGGIVFVLTFTSFGVVRILGGVRRSTIEVEIWREAMQSGNVGAAAALTVLQLVAVAVVVAVAAWLQRRSSRAVGIRPRHQRRAPRGRQRVFVLGVAVATAAVVVIPLAGLVERSFRASDGHSVTAWRTLGRSELRPGIPLGVDPLASLAMSLQTMVVATVLAVSIGTLAALAIVVSGRAGRVLEGAMLLPLATSAVTVGLGMLITFDRAPVDWRASWWLLPVGHALVALPFVVRTILPVLRAVDVRRVEAAATLGAAPLRAWSTVLVPHLRRPAALAAGLSAAMSLGEFGATSFLSRAGRATMPIAIEKLLGRPGALLQAQGYALATILAAATIAVVVIIDLFSRERS